MKNHTLDVEFDKALRLKKGLFAHNVRELVTELKFLTDEEFNHFEEQHPDVISKWIFENYNDEKTYKKLKKLKTRKQHINYLENLIKRSKKNNKQPLTAISVIIIIIVFVWAIQYIYYGSPTDHVSETQKLIDENYENKILIQTQLNTIEILKSENKDLRNKLSEKDESTTTIIVPKEEQTPTPSDRVILSDISIYTKEIRISKEGIVLAELENTGSMLPVLSSTSIALQIIPKTKEEIIPGDIISYKLGEDIIIHRVIEVGTDFSGWYAITKGDNNQKQDLKKVRFEQIERVLIGILY